jgi:hypothetical protein
MSQNMTQFEQCNKSIMLTNSDMFKYATYLGILTCVVAVLLNSIIIILILQSSTIDRIVKLLLINMGIFLALTKIDTVYRYIIDLRSIYDANSHCDFLVCALF